MKIVIAGAHGNIAMLMHPMLKKRGHKVRGLIRKSEQKEELIKAGAEPVICDIEKEDDISEAVRSADAVVFAAGAGPGSGADRKWSVDRDGAIKLIEAAKKNGIDRYVMISAMGLDDPRGSDVFQVYQKAKAEADEALKNSGLNYTIIKPGRLTDEPGTAKISLAQKLESGEIPREDVAAVLVQVLEKPELSGYTLDLTTGNTTIEEAIHQIVK
ncbi:MAG: SDR family oxidoreductase [Balneolaceae bacterium]